MGEVLARDSMGYPVVIKNIYGKGTAIRIGTTFFQRYVTKPLEKNLNYLRDLLPQKLFTGVRLNNHGSELRLREMVSGKKRIFILLNSARKAEIAVLELGGLKGKLKSLFSEESYNSDGRTSILINLNAGEVKQFVFSAV
jgi:hypothetical protein